MSDYIIVQAILNRLLTNTLQTWDLPQLAFLIERAQETPYIEQHRKILSLLKDTSKALIESPKNSENTAASYVFLKLLETRKHRMETLMKILGLSLREQDHCFNDILKSNIPSVLYIILMACSDPEKSKRILYRLIELQYPDALALQARQLFQEGLIAQAITQFEHAQKLYEHTETPGVLVHTMAVQLAFHYFAQQGDREQVTRLCNDALGYFEEMRHSKFAYKRWRYSLNHLQNEHATARNLLAAVNDLPKPVSHDPELNKLTTARWIHLLHQKGWLSLKPDYIKAAELCDRSDYGLRKSIALKQGNTLNKITQELQRILGQSQTDMPWPIGYLGDAYPLTYQGRCFQVPREIHQLYTILNTPPTDMQLEQIQALTQESLDDRRLSFFRHISGTAPSKQTLALFKMVETRLREYQEQIEADFEEKVQAHPENTPALM